MSRHSWASRPTAGNARPANPNAPRSKSTNNAGSSSSGQQPNQQLLDLLAREDDRCPVCTKERYMNPSLRLLVSTCFHRACTDCVNRIFGAGKAVCPIPGCGRTLWKKDWNVQTFEDLGVEKEIGIRRQLARIFNKRESDFETAEEYDKYLEMVEEIVQNKINDTDIAATNALIDSYRASNESQIKKNQQLALEQKKLEQWQEQERMRQLMKRRKYYEELEAEERRRLEKERGEWLQGLAARSAAAANAASGNTAVPTAPSVGTKLKIQLNKDGTASSSSTSVQQPQQPPPPPKKHPLASLPAFSLLPYAPFLEDEPTSTPPWLLAQQTQPAEPKEQLVQDKTWHNWSSPPLSLAFSLEPMEVDRVKAIDPLWEMMKVDKGWEAGGNKGEWMKERALRGCVEGLFWSVGKGA